jgi:hypothetical protein
MSPIDRSHGREIEVEVIYPPGHPVRRKRKDTFVRVPLAEAIAITKAVRAPKAMVALMVLYEAWVNKGKPFPLSNIKFAGCGVTHDTKRRALADMVAAALIAVEQKGKSSPIVTWIGARLDADNDAEESNPAAVPTISLPLPELPPAPPPPEPPPVPADEDISVAQRRCFRCNGPSGDDDRGEVTLGRDGEWRHAVCHLLEGTTVP